MKIKSPCIIDTAYNNLGANWAMCSDRFEAMYIKATEGQYTRDPQFASSWAQALTLNKPRAAYHFYREHWGIFPRDPVKEAQFFHDTVMPQGFIAGDHTVLDMEDDRMTIQKILACLREMRRLFGQWPWGYSSVNFLDFCTTGWDDLTESDIADLKQVKMIIAGYPGNPDLYDAIPSYLLPKALQFFGPVIGWQYGADYKNHGWPGFKTYDNDLDFNIFTPEALEDWRQGYQTAPVPEPPPVITPSPVPLPAEGYILAEGSIVNTMGEDARYHLAAFDLTKFDIILDAGMNFMTTDQWAAKVGADYAVNGPTGWYSIPGKRGRGGNVAPDGCVLYHGRGSVLFGGLNIYIDPTNRFSIARPKALWNAAGFPNLLVVDGKVTLSFHALDDIRARTAFGVNKDQSLLYVLTVDGADYWEKHGLNFQQTAGLLQPLCDLAWMGDGGGSTTCVRQDAGVLTVVGTPKGEENRIVNGTPYRMRIVATHFGLKRRPA